MKLEIGYPLKQRATVSYKAEGGKQCQEQYILNLALYKNKRWTTSDDDLKRSLKQIADSIEKG